MSIFDTVAANAAVQTSPDPVGGTMQDLHGACIANNLTDLANAVARLSDYFAQPLSQIPMDELWFDKNFPLAKHARDVPGRERSFWKNKVAYNRWRQKVGSQIRHLNGFYDRRAQLRAQVDGWTTLLDLLRVLSKNGGPVHGAELGNVQTFVEHARLNTVDLPQLNRETMVCLLDATQSSRKRKSVSNVLRVLERYTFIKAVAAQLPDAFEFEVARRRAAHLLPARIEHQIENLVQNAQRAIQDFDDISKEYVGGNSVSTINSHRSALCSYVWAASNDQSGSIDINTLEDITLAFADDVFAAVIRHWTDTSEEIDGLAPRSAYKYVGNIMTVLSRNDLPVEFMKRAKKNNLFLREGKEASEVMSPKVRAFCEPIVRDKKVRKRFLTQHLEYRKRAEDLLATDRRLSGSRLSDIRTLGACAAFAALEIAGAPLRVTNALQLRHRGPTANVLLPSPASPHYLVSVDAVEIKTKKQMEPFKVRKTILEGRQTLDWYLSNIRSLFPFGNRIWCETGESGLNVDFGQEWTGKDKTNESIYLFPAPTSPKHLSKSLFYIWLTECSEEIGLPMTPHLFRNGIASIHLRRSLANLGRVAVLLNNSPTVVRTNYAWINKEAVIEEAQDELLQEVSI